MTKDDKQLIISKIKKEIEENAEKLTQDYIVGVIDGLIKALEIIGD